MVENNGNWAKVKAPRSEAVEDRANDNVDDKAGYLSPSTSTPTATSTSSRPMTKESPGTRTTAPSRTTPKSTRSLVLARPTYSFNPTPRPSISPKPTYLPTHRPTMKQFHCAENAVRRHARAIAGAADVDSSCTLRRSLEEHGNRSLPSTWTATMTWTSWPGTVKTTRVAWYPTMATRTSPSFRLRIRARPTPTRSKGAKDVFAIDVDDDGDIDVLSASFDDDKIAW